MLFATSQGPPVESARPVIAWEDAPCPQCAGRHGTPLVEAQDQHAGADGLWFAVVQCDSCGTCFTNPRPDPASIAQFHAENHRPRRKPPAIPWHGRGRLLDVGGGDGAHLRAMTGLGWDVTGLTATPQAAQRLRDKHGLRAFAGSLPHLDLEPESFDVITIWDALPLAHEPAPLLREARHLLVPGGKLYVAAPNIDSLPYRWFGRDWTGLDLPRRLTHFTPASLLEMLQRCGLATEPIRFLRSPAWLRASARRACAAQARPPRWQRLLRCPGASDLVTWLSFLTQQSDCILAVGHR